MWAELHAQLGSERLRPVSNLLDYTSNEVGRARVSTELRPYREALKNSLHAKESLNKAFVLSQEWATLANSDPDFIFQHFYEQHANFSELMCECARRNSNINISKLLAVWTLACHAVRDTAIAPFYNIATLHWVVWLVTRDRHLKPHKYASQASTETDVWMLSAEIAVYGSFLRSNLTLIRLHCAGNVSFAEESVQDWLAAEEPQTAFDEVADKILKKFARLSVGVSPEYCIHKDMPQVEDLHCHIQRCFRITSERSVYASYFALCNSSGMGKTRAAIETAQRKGYDYIFLCLRDPKDRIVPPLRPSSIIHDVLCHSSMTLGQWCYLIIAALTQYLVDDGPQTHDFHETRFVNHLPFWESVLRRYHMLIAENSRVIAKVETGNDPSMDARYILYKAPVAALQNKTLHAALSERNKQLLFIVDEASILLHGDAYRPCGSAVTAFNMFRRALHCMPSDFPVMIILVDSNIAVTMPVTKQLREPEARAVFYSENLLPPFYALPLSVPGILHGKDSAAFRTSFTTEVRRQALTVKHNPLQLAALSRPLFAANLVNCSSGSPSNRAVAMTSTLVQQKLWNGYTLNAIDRSESDYHLQLLAIACVRFWLLPTVRETQEAMLHRHLAVCSGISDDRSRLIVQYKSEPALGEAAMLSVLSDQIFLEMLQVVNAHLRAGTVLTASGIGDVHELLAAIILTRANDTAIMRSTVRHRVTATWSPLKVSEGPTIEAMFADKAPHRIVDETDFRSTQGSLSRPVPLLHLLEGLFSEAEMVAICAALRETKPRLLAAVVCYNHHLRLGYDPQPADLRCMLQRYAAGLCRARNQGADLIIPLALPLPGAASVDVHSSASFDIGALFIRMSLDGTPANQAQLAGLMSANTTVRSLGHETTLLLLLSNSAPDTTDSVGSPVTVHPAGRGKKHKNVLLHRARCLTEVGRPPCLTPAVLKVLNEMRRRSDLLGGFEEDQLTSCAATAETLNARKKAFDPGSLACDGEKVDERADLVDGRTWYVEVASHVH